MNGGVVEGYLTSIAPRVEKDVDIGIGLRRVDWGSANGLQDKGARRGGPEKVKIISSLETAKVKLLKR